MNILFFILGCFVGGTIGLFAASLCKISKRADEN